MEKHIVSASGERDFGDGNVGRTGWKRRVSRPLVKAKEG